MADVSLPGDDDAAQARSSGGRSLLVIAVILGAGGAGGYFVWRSMQASAQSRSLATASTAWRSLSRCLTGDEPLAANEELAWRVHRIELGREPVPADAGDAATAGFWPYRCAPFATSLRDSLRGLAHADAAQTRLATVAERARNALVHGQTGTLRMPDGQPSYLDELFTAARAAHLPAPGAASGPPPPTAAAALLTRADFRPLFTTHPGVDTQVVTSDRTPGSGLRVLLAHGNLMGCRFIASADAAQNLATARCAPVTAEPIASLADVTLFDGDDDFDGFPPVRAGTGSAVRLFGLPGTATAPTPRPFAFRGAIARDGLVSVVDSNNTELDDAAASGHWRLSRQRGTTAGFRGALTLPEGSSRPDFAGADRLLWLASSEPGHGPARVGLFARTLLDRPAPFGPTLDVGDVPEDSRIAARCRTAQGPAVVVSAPTAVQLALGGADRWGAFTRVEGRARPVTANCMDDSATATWLDARSPTVHQIRCTAASCTPAEARLSSLAPAITRGGDNFQIADLGGRVIVVWSPQEGGLRMRMAPLAQLDAARDVVLYDDHAHRGGWVQNVALFVRRNTAVVFFVDSESDADGKRPFAVRIDAAGAFRPVTPEG